ncbi:MAG TPA: type 2 lanthipeptide synthetase LanM [Kofleriaceae bacterium]|nr:type 2 lanthipeptide synthetase LanM [Kofleriaceae bacterium]
MDRGLRGGLRGPLIDPGSPAERALAPWIAAARAELDACCDRAAVAVLPPARRDLAALVTGRLVAVAGRLLVHEQRALAAAGAPAELDASAEAWRDRAARYPGLAELLARAAADACAHAGELLARLAADRDAIAAELLDGRPPGALAGVRGDTGDVHDGGRAVAVLQFDDGRGVVYKPKDLRIARAVLDLCAWLAPGLPLALPHRRLVVRPGHAWETRIAPAPCRSLDEVRRFYLRIGMLVGLFELLEARDLWLDNLIAAGEYPVFIDLEMVVQPRRSDRAGEPAEIAAEDRLHDGAAHLGILAMPTLIAPGVAAEEIGALTSPRGFASPFRAVPALDAIAGVTRTSRDGFALWHHDAHAPTLAGQPVRAADHLDDLLAGYRALYRAVAARRDELLAPGGPIDALAGLLVRVIQRNTWSCYRITQASLAPRLLADPARRAAWLDGLLAEARSDAERAVARSEIAALARLDVPYFLCRTGGDDLLAPDGSVVARGWFDGAALDRVRRRIRDAGDAPGAAREDLVRSAFATGLREPAPPARRIAATRGAEPDWLAEAAAIGDLVLAEAIHAGDGIAWIGATLDPFHALRRIDVLGPDLVTGAAGIAIVLADLAAATGLARFRDAARAAISCARRSRRDEPLGGAPPAIGALFGAGARIFALHRCAAALDAPELAAAAAALAATTAAAIPDAAPLDAITGATGLLLSLLAAGAGSDALDACAGWIDARLAAPDARRSPYPARSAVADLPVPAAVAPLADLPSCLALAGARLARRTGGAPRWTADHPALLVQLALADAPCADRAGLAARAALAAEARRAVDTAADPLDALDLALIAAHALADAGLAAHARSIGRDLVARHRGDGRWFPDRAVADRHDLSALTGLAALAHAFLRLADPRHAPSIRLLASRVR